MLDKSVFFYGVQVWLIACQIAGRSEAACSFNRGDKIPANFECRVQFGSGAGQLNFQSDGNLVIYDGSGRSKWDTHTAGRGDQAVFQTDGNLVIYDIANKAVWNSQTAGRGRRLVFQDDRNLVIYDNANKAVWNSGSEIVCK
ncbi:comitin-like [Paramacrobiotus metropolitanus]|uniref:comitin-like n=1 Tax=Paramacrobiotus metropolitanus TaxID=2943436 RepID=UPI00244594B0|nr:comitin-like [Paramacrobiotus metropolitanus]